MMCFRACFNQNQNVCSKRIKVVCSSAELLAFGITHKNITTFNHFNVVALLELFLLTVDPTSVKSNIKRCSYIIIIIITNNTNNQ